MSRLLFAAARGARIEGRYHNWRDGGTEWRKTDDLNKFGNRIHPDGAHLAYGPISTDIRSMTLIDLHATEMPPLALRSACVCGIQGTWAHEWRKQSVDDRATAMLILAEALADEGL
jgi:hypothetical protein